MFLRSLRNKPPSTRFSAKRPGHGPVGLGEGVQARRHGRCLCLPWLSGLHWMRDLWSMCHVSASPWQQKHSPKPGLRFPRRGLSCSQLPSPAGKGNTHSRAFRELVGLHRMSGRAEAEGLFQVPSASSSAVALTMRCPCLENPDEAFSKKHTRRGPLLRSVISDTLGPVPGRSSLQHCGRASSRCWHARSNGSCWGVGPGR